MTSPIFVYSISEDGQQQIINYFTAPKAPNTSASWRFPLTLVTKLEFNRSDIMPLTIIDLSFKVWKTEFWVQFAWLLFICFCSFLFDNSFQLMEIGSSSRRNNLFRGDSETTSIVLYESIFRSQSVGIKAIRRSQRGAHQQAPRLNLHQT